MVSKFFPKKGSVQTRLSLSHLTNLNCLKNKMSPSFFGILMTMVFPKCSMCTGVSVSIGTRFGVLGMGALLDGIGHCNRVAFVAFLHASLFCWLVMLFASHQPLCVFEYVQPKTFSSRWMTSFLSNKNINTSWSRCRIRLHVTSILFRIWFIYGVYAKLQNCFELISKGLCKSFSSIDKPLFTSCFYLGKYGAPASVNFLANAAALSSADFILGRKSSNSFTAAAKLSFSNWVGASVWK